MKCDQKAEKDHISLKITGHYGGNSGLFLLVMMNMDRILNVLLK